MNTKNTALACMVGLALAVPLVLARDATAADARQDSLRRLEPRGLVKTVIQEASQYRDVDAAVDAGYQALTGCVSGEYGGAQGVHFVNLALLGDGTLNPATPEVLLYEPTYDGGMRLVGAEYLADKARWHEVNGAAIPPIVDGQHMFLLDEPNRFVIHPAYALRVWAFKPNPGGMFALSNRRVTCEYYEP